MNIYITNDKINILNSIKPFTNYKIYTIEELYQIYPYKYDDKAIDYLISKHNILLNNAKLFLSLINKYSIDNLDNSKSHFLQNIRDELINNNLLTKNKLLYTLFKRSNIYITYDKELSLDNYLKDFNINYITSTPKYKIETINEALNIEEEITIIGEKIIELYKQNIPLNKIYILNNYDNSIQLERILTLLNIPYNINHHYKISSTYLGSIILKNLNMPINDIKNFLDNNHTSDNDDTYKTIIDIINKYYYLDNYQQFIKDALTNTDIKEPIYTNAINIIKTLKPLKDDEYLFISNLTKDFPRLSNNTDYFNDLDALIINKTPSNIKNNIIINSFNNLLKSIKNLYISYPLYDNNGNENKPYDNKLEIKKISPSLNVSNLYNKLLLARELDIYNKYNTISNRLKYLEKIYDIPYKTYDNNFKKTNITINNLSLSYTTLNEYLTCPFKYYLKNILKLNSKKDDYKQFIGTLYHEILSNINDDTYDINKEYDNVVNSRIWSSKELFFIKKLKANLQDVIQILEQESHHQKLNKLITEKEIRLKENDYEFVGKIDKIKYLKEDDYSIIEIVDYKTGKSDFKMSYINLGFDLQLPIYLYLIKKSSIFENPIIGGIYLQSIIPERIKYNDKEDYKMQRRKMMLLNGFTLENKDILPLIDDTYENSSIIQSLKVKNDGSFYKSSKTIDNKKIDEIYNLVEKYINETVNNIKNNNFEITCKIIDNKDDISCKYCPYKNICFKTNKNNIYLETQRSEENGLDN